MFDELAVLSFCEIVILSLFLLFSILFIWLSLWSICSGGAGDCYIHYNGEPGDNCKDCHGTGVINKGDTHFECDCPCKMRIVR